MQDTASPSVAALDPPVAQMGIDEWAVLINWCHPPLTHRLSPVPGDARAGGAFHPGMPMAWRNCGRRKRTEE